MRKPAVALALAVPLLVAAAAGAAGASPRVGTFTAELDPVNSPEASGMVTLDQRGSNLHVDLHASGLDDGIHLAHIHGVRQAMAECPTMSRDTNGDGFVDFAEGLPDYGPVVRTLNGTPPETGTALNYMKMFRQLDNGDGIASLGPLEDFAIVIHGVDLDGDGVANKGDVDGDGGDPDDNEIAMPALCGEIERQ